MFKRKTWYGVFCFLLMIPLLSGCSQQGQGESSSGNQPNQETASQSEKDEQGSRITYYPSGPEFIKSIIKERGQVQITDGTREKFNLFARDYRWNYLPDMDYYESFFDTDQYAQSFGYNNFSSAVFYMLSYMRYLQKVSAEEMEGAIQSLFVAQEKYEPMTHQAFRKLANYEDGYYSPWPEGTPDFDREFYLLTGLEVEEKGLEGVYITVQAQYHYFNDPAIYKSGADETWLTAKAREMGLSDMDAAAKLISNGQMKELASRRSTETTIFIKYNGQNPENYAPRFVSHTTTYES